MLALPLAASAAMAADGGAQVPITTGEIIRDYARITFEWPETVNFTADAHGKLLTVKFDRPANPDFGSLLSNLYPYVISIQRKSDGKTLSITLDRPYKIRTFIANNISGIDLLKIDPQKRAGFAANRLLAENANSLSPSAGNEAAATSGDGGDAAAITANQDGPATAPEQTGHVKVSISASDDSATLRFPFNERIALATFIRNGYLWVVFNKPMAMDLSDFKDLPKTVIGKGEVMKGRKNVLRVPVNDLVRASVAREESSFEWVILLTMNPRPAAVPLKVNINTDPPAPANVFIPSLQMGDPLTLRDPIIGDDLVVTPLFNTGEAIPFTRDFVEFTLLETAQGVVVAKKADSVSVTTLRNGLRISLPQGGATLTPGLPEVDRSISAQALQSVATLFPYSQWKLDQKEPRRKQLRELFRNVVAAPTPSEANDSRMRLAQVYLGEGLAAEAIAELDGINRTDPVYYRTNKLAALRGASNFLMGRNQDAARDFAASELNNNKETDFWRNVLADLLGKPAQYDYMEMNPDYISKYPPVMRQRLAIVASDRAVDSKEYNTAIKVFDTLHPEKNEDKEDLIAPINSYVSFILAKIAVDTEQLQDGLTSWNKLAEDYGHPFVQARAEFSRVIWQMNHNSLSKQQVIDRLERLRMAWHGDALELKVLTLLGDLYAEQKDYVNAMRIWDDGVNGFPNTPNSIEMAHRMEETFILMFNEGTADTLPAIDALALYYQYKNYAPPGSTGRDMINHLADRLVSIDLLDQASSLLEHQMRYEAEKVQRSQLGAKIATIHLLNHNPKKALQALEDSVYGENPALLRQQRNRLASEALYELGDPDKSWIILGQDDSADAERIRLNIYWDKKDWPNVIHTVEAMLKARKDVSAPITVDESEYVLKLALAYIFQNNTVQLQYLHDYFKPLMANNPNKDVFEFITAADVAPTPTNFDQIIKNLSATRSFINNYKARIEQGGLDAVVPAAKSK